MVGKTELQAHTLIPNRAFVKIPCPAKRRPGVHGQRPARQSAERKRPGAVRSRRRPQQGRVPRPGRLRSDAALMRPPATASRFCRLMAILAILAAGSAGRPVAAEDASVAPERTALVRSVICEGIDNYAPLNPGVVFSINLGRVSCLHRFRPGYGRDPHFSQMVFS